MRAATEPKPPPCKVCTFPPDIVEAIDTGLDEGVAISSLIRWLRAEGFHISETGIAAHNRKRQA